MSHFLRVLPIIFDAPTVTLYPLTEKICKPGLFVHCDHGSHSHPHSSKSSKRFLRGSPFSHGNTAKHMGTVRVVRCVLDARIRGDQSYRGGLAALWAGDCLIIVFIFRLHFRTLLTKRFVQIATNDLKKKKRKKELI